MFARVQSYGLSGIDGYAVTVEANVSGGMPLFEVVGLPDAAVRESRERVRAALANSGLTMPFTRVVINLAPADQRKSGPMYDLPIALAILAASEQLPLQGLRDVLFLGELSMDGKLQPVRGALPIAVSALSEGYRRIVLPDKNAPELDCLPEMQVLPAPSLRAVVEHLRGETPLAAWETQGLGTAPDTYEGADLAQVIGQHMAKRALEIAAAGGHSMLMIGPPGAGKTMLARCMRSVLPDMTREEALDVARIYSVAGALAHGEGLAWQRPFRAPHHSASLVSIVGGGQDAHPGEIILAHCGVLFLDELAEFPRAILDGLRQPLEDGFVSIARARSRVTYPARVMLVAAMNPCPCGYYGSSVRACRCTQRQVAQYQGRVSGPMLDRIDLRVEVGAVTAEEIEHATPGESSASVRARVQAAREIQRLRLGGQGIYCNAQMNAKQLDAYCMLTKQAEQILSQAVRRFGLSMRGRDRVRKVSRTIADLAALSQVEEQHIAEALQYRGNLMGER